MDYQTLRSIFLRGTCWSAYETITFNILLTVHTTMLFMVMPAKIYGILGTLLSVSYMISALATLGNDITTGLLLGVIPSRDSMRSTLASHAIHASIISMMGIVGVGTWLYTAAMYKYFILFLYGICLVYVEISRKIIKSVLLATHNFNLVAHTEIASMLVYMLSIWALYSMGYSLTPCMLVIPLILCTGSTAIIFGILLYKQYILLPEGVRMPSCEIYAIKIRASLHGITGLIFSGNIMVPLAATFIGKASAGGMKLASSLIQNGTNVAERTFCTTSSLLFSRTTDLMTSRRIMMMIHNTMLPCLAIGSIFLYGILYYLMSQKNLIGILPTIAIYLIMQCCGMISNIFERFLFAKNQPGLVNSQVCILACSGTIMYCGKFLGYQNMIIALSLVRLVFLLIFMYLSHGETRERDTANVEGHQNILEKAQ